MDWVFWYLFSFKGRINRAKYWLAGLIILCWMIFLGGLTLAIGQWFGGPTSFGSQIEDLFKIVDPESYRALSWAGLPMLVVRLLGTSLFLWVYLATSIKRLHDRDKTAWWMVPFFVVPGLYQQFADRLPDDSNLAMLLGLLAAIFSLWGGIEMYFLKGLRQTNRFGANPLRPAARNTRPRWEQNSEIEMVPHKAGPPPQWYVRR